VVFSRYASKHASMSVASNQTQGFSPLEVLACIYRALMLLSFGTVDVKCKSIIQYNMLQMGANVVSVLKFQNDGHLIVAC
jgi:hypothetical protein